MVRFYLDMFRDFTDVFRGTVEAWLFWIWTIAVPLVVFFNPELEGLMDEWVSVSRWWALLPIAASVAYGMLRVNYRRFQALEEKVAGLRRRAVRQGAVNALARLREEANRTLFNNVPGDSKELDEWVREYQRWHDDVADALRNEFTYATVHRFTDLVEMPVRNRGNVMTMGSDEDRRRHQHFVNLLAAKLRMLGEIIQEHDLGTPIASRGAFPIPGRQE